MSPKRYENPWLPALLNFYDPNKMSTHKTYVHSKTPRPDLAKMEKMFAVSQEMCDARGYSMARDEDLCL